MNRLEDRRDKYDDAEALVVSMMEKQWGERVPELHLMLAMMLQAGRDKDYIYLNVDNHQFVRDCELSGLKPEAIVSWIRGL